MQFRNSIGSTYNISIYSNSCLQTIVFICAINFILWKMLDNCLLFKCNGSPTSGDILGKGCGIICQSDNSCSEVDMKQKHANITDLMKPRQRCKPLRHAILYNLIPWYPQTRPHVFGNIKTTGFIISFPTGEYCFLIVVTKQGKKLSRRDVNKNNKHDEVRLE